MTPVAIGAMTVTAVFCAEADKGNENSRNARSIPPIGSASLAIARTGEPGRFVVVTSTGPAAAVSAVAAAFERTTRINVRYCRKPAPGAGNVNVMAVEIAAVAVTSDDVIMAFSVSSSGAMSAAITDVAEPDVKAVQRNRIERNGAHLPTQTPAAVPTIDAT